MSCTERDASAFCLRPIVVKRLWPVDRDLLLFNKNESPFPHPPVRVEFQAPIDFSSKPALLLATQSEEAFLHLLVIFIVLRARR
jgi:hypothetical protein